MLQSHRSLRQKYWRPPADDDSWRHDVAQPTDLPSPPPLLLNIAETALVCDGFIHRGEQQCLRNIDNHPTATQDPTNVNARSN